MERNALMINFEQDEKINAVKKMRPREKSYHGGDIKCRALSKKANPAYGLSVSPWPRVIAVLMFFILTASPLSVAFGNPRGGEGGMMGIPFSSLMARSEVDTDICPQGARIVEAFLSAWAEEDFQTMFSLIHEPERSDYTIEDMEMELRFVGYRRYQISSVRRKDDDFEFLLSYGDWRHADKDMKKVVVNGETFKIMVQRNRSIFTGSLASYF